MRSQEEWERVLTYACAYRDEIIVNLMDHTRSLKTQIDSQKTQLGILIPKAANYIEDNKKLVEREQIMREFLDKRVGMSIEDIDEFIVELKYNSAVKKRNKEKDNV